MGCGCRDKKAMRNTMPRAGVRPVVGPRPSQQGNIVSAQTPTQMRAAQTPAPERSAAGMNQERRLIEKKRRDAIRNALGKG